MDVKGQHDCERCFLLLMWICTALSFALGLALDSVRAMFATFGAGLGVSTALCLPEWPMFNKTPLKFKPSKAAAPDASGQAKPARPPSKSS